MKNPAWQRDELILALSLYFSEPYNSLNVKHPKVLNISKALNQLRDVDKSFKNDTFRNPQGVYMKLGNFLAIDPMDERRGLPGHSKLDKAVFYDFWERRDDLFKIASIIQATIDSNVDFSEVVARLPSDLDEELNVKEGKVFFRIHRFREEITK